MFESLFRRAERLLDEPYVVGEPSLQAYNPNSTIFCILCVKCETHTYREHLGCLVYTPDKADFKIWDTEDLIPHALGIVEITKVRERTDKYIHLVGKVRNKITAFKIEQGDKLTCGTFLSTWVPAEEWDFALTHKTSADVLRNKLFRVKPTGLVEWLSA